MGQHQQFSCGGTGQGEVHEGVGQDERASPRRRTLKAGKVVLQNGSVFDCAIRNLSEGGAQLRIAEPIPLPADFQLYWPEIRKIRPCQNRWQRGVDCGVAFTGPERPTLRDYK